MTENFKMIVIVAMLALASSLPCVKATRSSSRIAGGVEASLGSIPHQVAVTRGDQTFCSGSIIDRDFIITAGQCCTFIRPGGILAGLNDIQNPEEGAQEVQVRQFVPHPSFTVGKRINDVCVLHLQNSLILGNATRTAIIKLPSADYVAAGNANVSGWGITANSSSKTQMVAQVPVLSDDKCRQYYGSNDSAYIVESTLCAGDKGKGACLGDTGGPLTDAKGYLVGLVSWGNACAAEDYIGVYTEVSYFVDWIHETMAKLRKAETSADNAPGLKWCGSRAYLSKIHSS